MKLHTWKKNIHKKKSFLWKLACIPARPLGLFISHKLSVLHSAVEVCSSQLMIYWWLDITDLFAWTSDSCFTGVLCFNVSKSHSSSVEISVSRVYSYCREHQPVSDGVENLYRNTPRKSKNECQQGTNFLVFHWSWLTVWLSVLCFTGLDSQCDCLYCVSLVSTHSVTVNIVFNWSWLTV